MDPLTRLNTLIDEVVDLQHAASLLEWDEQVYMPPGVRSTHGDMVATIRKIAHEKFTSDAVGRATRGRQTQRTADGGDPTRRTRWPSLRMNTTRRARSSRLRRRAGAGGVGALSTLGRGATSSPTSPRFKPHLEKVVDLKRRYVGFFPPARIRTTCCSTTSSRA
jgi:carboxypeptidase Taq